VFAILGLRSLYFALADLLGRFHYLKYSLVAILGFVGIKMLVHDILPHEQTGLITLISLAFIAISLGIGIAASLLMPEEHKPHDPSDPT
jgi:tellurite resistance protein TerC